MTYISVSSVCTPTKDKVFLQSVHKPKYCFGDKCTTRMTYVQANLWLWNVLVIFPCFYECTLDRFMISNNCEFQWVSSLILQAKPNLMLVPFGDHTETPFKHFVRPCLGLNCLTLLSYSGMKFELVYKANHTSLISLTRSSVHTSVPSTC